MIHPPRTKRHFLFLPVLCLSLLAACGSEDPQKLLASARQYQANNDPAAAIIQLKNALQQQSDLPEARFLLGQALLQTGDLVGGETELQRARDLGYPMDEVAPLLARARLWQGKFREVTSEFDQLRLGQPAAQAELLTQVAVAWRQQGQLDASERALEGALQAVPEHAPARIEQARAQAAKRDFNAALAVLDGVIERAPDNSDALKFKGDILLYGLARSDHALDAYRSALKVKPDAVDARAALVRGLLSQKQLEPAAQELAALIAQAPGQPQTLYLQGQMAFQKGDFQAANGHVQQLLKLAPQSPAALELGGAIDFRLGHFSNAESNLARLVQVAPELTLARRVLLMTYLRTGQVERAIAVLPSNLESNDVDPAMLAIAGQAFMLQGDIGRAEQLFARSAQLDPADPAKRTSLAVSQLMGGKTVLALDALQDIAATDTGVSADLALINVHLQRRDLDKALAAIAAMEKKQASDPLPLQLRGRALLMRDDRAGARQAFESALQRSPDYFAATAALSALDVLDGKPQDAKARLDEQIQRNPKNAPALMARAELAVRAGDDPVEVQGIMAKAIAAAPGDKAPRLMLIEYLLRRGDAKAALTAAQSAVAALPLEPEMLDALGRAQIVSGEFNQAEGNFKKLIGMVPRSPIPHLRLASVHMARKDMNAAGQSLRKALEVQANHLPTQRALVDLALQSGKIDEALVVVREIQAQRPKEDTGYLMEGHVHAAAKNWNAAVQAYRNGMKVVPSAELAMKLHAALVAGGQVAQAAQVATDWAKSHPRDVAFPLYLGGREIEAGQWAQAARHYERVLQLQPRHVPALNNLAWAAGKLGRSDALGLAEKANSLAPNQPALMDTLAVLLSERNQHDRAIKLQSDALKAQPDNATFKLHLAKMQLKAGNATAARTLLKELSALGKQFSAHEEVQSLLSKS